MLIALHLASQARPFYVESGTYILIHSMSTRSIPQDIQNSVRCVYKLRLSPVAFRSGWLCGSDGTASSSATIAKLAKAIMGWFLETLLCAGTWRTFGLKPADLRSVPDLDYKSRR